MFKSFGCVIELLSSCCITVLKLERHIQKGKKEFKKKNKKKTEEKKGKKSTKKERKITPTF